MSVMNRHKANAKSWRSKVFPFLSGLLALLLIIVAAFEYITAWVLRDPGEDIHLWHIAELVALAILLAAPMIMLIRRPEEKPVLAQFLIISSVILAIGIMPFEMKAAALFLIAALFAVTYPVPRSLLSFSREGGPSIAKLVLTALISLYVLPIAWKEIQLQIIGTGNDVHAAVLHWIGSALLIVLLVLAPVLSATKRPGWKQLGILTGITYCFLGITALLVPDYAGSWGNAGALFAIFTGIFYILFTIAETQSTRDRAALYTRPANTEEMLPDAATLSEPVSKVGTAGKSM